MIVTEQMLTARDNTYVPLADRIGHWFTYHAPTPEQLVQYNAVREAGKIFAKVIAENTPISADQSAAIRKVREAVFTANSSIACGGR